MKRKNLLEEKLSVKKEDEIKICKGIKENSDYLIEFLL